MMKLTFLLFSIFLVHGLNAAKPKFLDEDKGLVLKDIGKKVCWSWSGSRNQIIRYSTIEKLVKYFESLPAEHELSSCAKNHLKSLRALWLMISTGNEDVCAEEKLGLIEKFHYEHFGETYRSKPIELPRVLRAFFYQYASRISNVCATSSYNYFESDLSKIMKMPELDRALEKSVDQLTGEQGARNYQDLYMVWSLMDRFSKNIHTNISDYVNGELKRMYVKISEINNLKKFQQTCSESIKPIYSQTILPALRLIDLGYYPDETEFLTQLLHNTFVNRLYKMTVICETILPVRLILSTSDDNQTYLVKPAGVQPTDLDSEPENIATSRLIEPAPRGPVNMLPLRYPDYAFRRCRRIGADVKSREKSIVKIVKLLVKSMKKESYSNVKLWDTKSSIEPMFREVVEKVEEAEPQARRKRSLKTSLRSSVLVVRNFVFLSLTFTLIVICTVFKFVYMFSSGIAIGFYKFPKMLISN